MKKFIVICAALVVLFTCVMFSQAAKDVTTKEIEQAKLGDVVTDGKLTTGDAVVILKYCNDMCEFDDLQLMLADVNQNDKINTGDATALLRMIVGLDEEAYIDIGEKFEIDFMLYDAFNQESIGIVTAKIPIVEGDTKIIINNNNFSDYLKGYAPFNTTFYAEFDIVDGEVAPHETPSCNVYRYEVKDVMGSYLEHRVVTTRYGLDSGVRSNMKGNYILYKDIEMRVDGNLTSFKPLGWTESTHTAMREYDGEVFTGVFDGNGHTISALKCAYGTDDGSSYVGLFAVSDGIIKDLTLDIDTIVGKTQVGAVTARATENSIISNVHVLSTQYSKGCVESTMLDGSQYPGTGGVVGYNLGEVTMSSCTIRYVCGSNEAGGFCGSNFGTISESYSTCGVNTKYASSIVAGDYYTTVTGSSYFAEAYCYVGGFVGENEGTIINCYADLKELVVACDFVGGFVGVNFTNGKVINCWVKPNGLVDWCTVYKTYCVGDDMGQCSIYGTTRVVDCYIVGSGQTVKYYTEVDEAQFASYTNANPLPNYSLEIWDFGSASTLPRLVNNREA